MITSKSDRSSQPPVAREPKRTTASTSVWTARVLTEIDCGRVGTRVDYGRQLVADAVSSHRRHGMVSGRPARRRQWTWWWSTTLVTDGSPAAGFQGRFGSQKMRDNCDYHAANGCASTGAADPFSGFPRAAKQPQATDIAHTRLPGACVASPNRASSGGSIGI